MKYNKLNNILGWLCFVIASATYVLTLEPSASFWDCGEFIAAAYKLQIVHQPGAPLFLMIQKIFSLLSAGDKTRVAYWMNVSSALCSGATILFMFWTITALAKKVLHKAGEELGTAKLITIMGSGLVGALAYTFSDTFWFSAVESEVYAMSSLCTAIVFWAVLKWEAHADEAGADKWLIFIAYVIGLSIGVHLLSLLVIPAVAIVYYFRKNPETTTKGVIFSLLIGIIILAVVQYGIIQYTVKYAAYADLFFVNTLGLGFGSGAVIFFILVIITLVFGILFTTTSAKRNIIIAAIAFLLAFTLGGGFWGFIISAAVILILEYAVKIRENAAALNFALICITFILFGYSSFAMIVIRAKADPNLNNSDPDNAFALLSYLNREQYGDRPLLYGPYFDSKPVDYKEGGKIYRKGKTKYEVAGRKYDQVYDRNTIFPRMYSDDPSHVSFYRDWMKLGESGSPSFTDNLGFFFSYQTGFMYARYLLWNFVGRQDDDQGHGNYTSGNWLSGINAVDAARLGSQQHLPPSIAQNKAHNTLYFLPLILGILGAVWHFQRDSKGAGLVALLFFFTGMAIVLYLNQTPLQPRERDYAYAGSFYAFAIWIGLAVAAIADWISKKLSPSSAGIIATVICLLAAPVLMAKEEWNDHDRSTKYTPRDFAIDYLVSCAPNAILFTYGDNDTYPLWYAQEVEGVRPDVRIVNLSLLGTDWYIRQMKQKMNESAPLPITMPDDKFAQGVRDVLRYNEYPVKGSVELKSIFDILTSDDPNDKIEMQDGSRENFLPTKNLKITINPEQIIKTNTVPASLKDSIAPLMEWKYNKNYVTKTELAMFDILAHNNWERPVYFAVTVPSDNYIGLGKYLYNEGFAYRLLPLKTNPADTSQQQDEALNPDVMYHNMMTKFVWGNMKNASYLDPESTRMINLIMKNFNQLAETLYSEGKTEEAKKALQKSLAVVPDYNYNFYAILQRYYTIDLLYKLKEVNAANKLTQQTADYINAELTYVGDILQSKSNLYPSDIQLGLGVLNELATVTKDNKQTALYNSIKNKLNSLETRFIGSVQQ